MSFYINNTNPSRPGPISGNGMNGLCEKVLIETTKVFDACVSLTTDTGVVLTVSNFNPASPSLPLTFISAQNTTGQSATISNLVIDRIESTPNYANVSLDVTIPVTVTYRDSAGTIGTGTASVTVTKSVILFVPQPSVTPINITATGLFSSTIGTYSAENTFTVTGCIEVVLKVVAVVDILVPSYGYPVIPPCQASQSNVCPGLGEMPLYPTAFNPRN